MSGVMKTNELQETLRNGLGKIIPLVDCSVTSDTQIIDNPFYDFKLFVSTLDADKTYLKGNESGTRRFSFKDYQNDAKNITEDIVFYVGRTDGKPVFENGLEVSMQICNKDNHTISTTFFPSETEESSKIVIYGMSPQVLPKSTGTYRIDGLIKVKGQIQLLSRINEVVFAD